MARDDILSRDYVAESRPIIQDTRRSQMLETLVSDSLDLLKMQTLNSQEIAREERAEERAGRKSVTDLENAKTLLETEYNQRIREGTEEWDRKESERIQKRFDDDLTEYRIIAGKDLPQLNNRLKAMKDVDEYARFNTRLDALILTNDKAIEVNKTRADQRSQIANASDPNFLATEENSGDTARALIFAKFEPGHPRAGQYILTDAQQINSVNSLTTTQRGISGDINLQKRLTSNMTAVFRLGEAREKLLSLKTLNQGNEEMVKQIDADIAINKLDEQNIRIANVNIRAQLAAERGEKKPTFLGRIQELKDIHGYEDIEAETHFNREVSGANMRNPEDIAKAQKEAHDLYGIPLGELEDLYNELTKEPIKGPYTPTPEAVVGPTTRWGTAAAEFAARPPDPEVPETIAMTAEIQREMERFDVETQAKADQITDPAEKSDWLEKRASARKTRERVLTDVSQAKEAQVDIPSGTYTVQGKEIRVEPTTNVLGGVTGLNIYPSNNFALSDVLNLPKTSAGKKVRITKKRDEELFNQIVATLLASQ